MYFEEENIVGKTYRKIAFLKIQGSEIDSKFKVMEKFRKEASHFRADAIIDVNVELIEKHLGGRRI